MITIALVVSVLSSFSPILLAESAPPVVAGLSREAAVERASRVSGAGYDLFFRLSETEPDFTGRVELSFKLTDASRPLRIDFVEGKILSAAVNGKKLDAPDYNGHFLTLPAASLTAGDNRVVMAFSHPYSQTGIGLYRFKDPADGKFYVYTDFEPYDANRLFPGFDQPDIKASYKLTVEAPGDWTVITAAEESEVSKAPGGARIWEFPKTKPFSTYLVSLHAGPYAEWKSRFEGKGGMIPLRLFARKSLAEHIDVEEWFDVTRRGLKFFAEYFDTPYPFGKYDQVIVPDFNSGAMENVAAVTFSERFVFRGKPTWRERSDRANVILHEMAHMWFGNLVTMKWWEDLWLNESFASYMASLSLISATEFKDSWRVFFLDDKLWAYWEDQLVTTHPIEADVPDTEQAFANFDGITYGKGASVLKQAAFMLGEQGFRDGVRKYFWKHAFSNARRQDFIGALQEGSGRELGGWTKEWLQTAGVNSLRADFTCTAGKITSFKLLQSAPAELPFLRRHSTQIALYEKPSNGTLRRIEPTVKVEYQGSSTNAPALLNRPCPDLVLLNHGDHDYVKTKLDAASLAAAKEGLSGVPDDLDRAMLWFSLWHMVQDAELSPLDYSELVLRHLPKEKDFQILSNVVETIHGTGLNSSSLLKYLSGDTTPWPDLFNKESARWEEFFWNRLKDSEPGGDHQKLWLDSYIHVARGGTALKRVAELLSGELKLPGLDIDQDRRWNQVVQLNRHSHTGAARLIASELKRDGSRRGQTAAIRAETVQPDWKIKEAWIKRITSEKSDRSLSDLKTAMRSLFPFEQFQLRRRFSEEFYAKLPTLLKSQSNEFLRNFGRNMAPTTCRTEDALPLTEFLDKNPTATPILTKELKVARQENERCVKIRTQAAKP